MLKERLDGDLYVVYDGSGLLLTREHCEGTASQAIYLGPDALIALGKYATRTVQEGNGKSSEPKTMESES